MKLSIVALFLTLSMNVFAADTLDKGLYLSETGSSCAYQVLEQTNDGVVVIFRNNPTVIASDPCAVGVDYAIKAEVLDSKTFIDLRTNTKFFYFSKY